MDTGFSIFLCVAGALGALVIAGGLIREEATPGAISALYYSIRGADYDFNGDLALMTEKTRLVDFLRQFSPYEHQGG